MPIMGYVAESSELSDKVWKRLLEYNSIHTMHAAAGCMINAMICIKHCYSTIRVLIPTSTECHTVKVQGIIQREHTWHHTTGTKW